MGQREWEIVRDLKDPKKTEERLARIADLEDRIYQTAAGVLEAFFAFHEVHPQQTEPPPAWVEEFGAEAAMQRLQVAKAGWLPQSVAPAATKLAAQVHAGISRGRRYSAQVKANTLNVAITLPAPTSAEHSAPVYPVKEMDR